MQDYVKETQKQKKMLLSFKKSLKKKSNFIMLEEIILHFGISLDEEIQKFQKLIENLRTNIIETFTHNIKLEKKQLSLISGTIKKRHEVERIQNETKKAIYSYYDSCKFFEEEYKLKRVRRNIKPYFRGDGKEEEENKARLYLRHKTVGEKQKIYKNFVTLYNKKCPKIINAIVCWKIIILFFFDIFLEIN